MIANRPPLFLLALIAALVTAPAGCDAGPVPAAPPAPRSGASQMIDIHSAGRPAEVVVRHARIDWNLDFDRKVLEGSVTWDLEVSVPGAPLWLDTRGLLIEGVFAPVEDGLEERPYELLPEDPIIGRPLRIDLREGDRRIVVRYATTSESEGLQWLDPAQTLGGKQPFLFSQAQSIMGRTFLPCQDSPGIRFTYEATVRTPPGIRAVMAAEIAEDEASPWHFRMPQAIPSYLVAIAAGELEQRAIGARSAVWAEPRMVEAAASEFRDTEAMIEASEELYGPYRWERYEILVLPPSFPFGGMENPRLTFATPTVITGDRSLVALVAHELAHSWSGNLVTNATWSDFWLNEGFTVYIERRIQERIFGVERAEMEAVLGRSDLQEDLDLLDDKDEILKVDLEGRQPDDAFSNVPYEKGYLLLRRLEEICGRERFDAFLMRWFDRFAFRSATTDDFKEALDRDLFAGRPEDAEKIDLHAWLHEPGLPADAPRATSDRFDRARAQAAAFSQGGAAEDLQVEGWITHEWLHFLRGLPADLGSERLAALDARFDLSGTRNSEILCEWLELCVKNEYEPAYERLEEFLIRVGRRKFLMPLYRALIATEAGRARARSIFAQAKPMYHSLSANSVEKLLSEAGE